MPELSNANLTVRTDLSNEVNEIVDTMAIYMDKVNSLSSFIADLKTKTTKIENEFNKMLVEINELDTEMVYVINRLTGIGYITADEDDINVDADIITADQTGGGWESDVDQLYSNQIEPEINDTWTDYEDVLDKVDVLDDHFDGYDSINKKLANATSLKNNPSLKSSMSTLNFSHSSAASISENIDLDMEDFLRETYLTDCTTILDSTITFLESKTNPIKNLISKLSSLRTPIAELEAENE